MENRVFNKQNQINFWWFAIIFQFFLLVHCSKVHHARHTSAEESPKLKQNSPPVKLTVNSSYVVIDNGIVELSLLNPIGCISGVKYNGIDNLLEPFHNEVRRGYWDTEWDVNKFLIFLGTNFSVIAQDANKVEVSFKTIYEPSNPLSPPINVDKRYVVLRGSSGFYSYGIFEHLKGWPNIQMAEARIAIKLGKKLYLNKNAFPANNSYIGLADPGDVGFWQNHTKGYQFWTQTDNYGNFKINNVRPGIYGLYSWVPGVMGDYKYPSDVTITQGKDTSLGKIIFEAPRNGPTLWEIGYPDRTAAEFFIPDPLPTLQNYLYTNTTVHKFRQYGLWDRYTDLNPKSDIVYRVGVDDFRKHWFFAHVTRRNKDKSRSPTTWQIVFNLKKVNNSGTYHLQIALAAAAYGHLQVWINNPSQPRPLFDSKLFGHSTAIARHGIHGLYILFNIEISGTQLHIGENIIYLKQVSTYDKVNGLMYDYIRLEGPSQ